MKKLYLLTLKLYLNHLFLINAALKRQADDDSLLKPNKRKIARKITKICKDEVLENLRLLKAEYNKFFNTSPSNASAEIISSDKKTLQKEEDASNTSIFCFDSGIDLIKIDSKNVFQENKNKKIKIKEEDVFELQDYAIIIRILYDICIKNYIENCNFLEYGKDMNDDIIFFKIDKGTSVVNVYGIYDGIHELLKKDIVYNNPDDFNHYLKFILNYVDLNLFEIYKATIVRRDFLQIIYLEIIPLEKYLLSFMIKLDKNKKKSSNNELRIVALIKTFMVLYSLNDLVEEIYNLYIDTGCTGQSNYLKDIFMTSSPFCERIDRLEILIQLLVTHSQTFNSRGPKTEDVYAKYIKLKPKFVKTQCFIRSVLFDDSTQETHQILDKMEQINSDNNKVYKIDTVWFYFHLIEYLWVIYEYKMNFTNDGPMWKELISLLEKKLTEVFRRDGNLVIETDMKFFTDICQNIKDKFIKTFQEKNITIVCRTKEHDIFINYVFYRRSIETKDDSKQTNKDLKV